MKEKIRFYFLNLTIMFMTWGGMLRRSFNADTMYHMVNDDHDIVTNISNGRYFSALLFWGLNKLGLDTTTHTGVTALISILILALAVTFLQCLLRKCFTPKTTLEHMVFIALTSLPFINVLYSEAFSFAEWTFGYAMTYCLASLACVLFEKKKYVLAFVCMLASTMFYQMGTMFAAIILSGYLFIKNHGKLSLEVFKQQALCIFITVVPGVVDMLSISVVKSLGIIEVYNKSVGITNLPDKIKFALRLNHQVLESNLGLFPDVYLPAIFLLLALGIIVWYLIHQKNKSGLVYLALLLLLQNGLVYGMTFLQSDPYMPPRMIFTFYCMVAMFALIAYLYINKKVQRGYAYLIIFFLVIQFWFIQLIVIDRYTSNTLDEVYTEMVYTKVQEYENETGNTIENFSIIRDIDSHLYYDEVALHVEQINQRALGIVNFSMLEYITGREFNSVEMPEEIFDTYFKDRDWKYIDLSEQLILEGDTAYWVIF